MRDARGREVADRQRYTEPPADRIQRLVSEGKMPQQAVDEARKLWQDRLQEGITVPNGEVVAITWDDLHHLIVDPRIWRKPERIETAILNVFEIHEAVEGRRQAFSRWLEGEKDLSAYVILDSDNTVMSLHVVRASELRRKMRGGQVLWKQ